MPARLPVTGAHTSWPMAQPEPLERGLDRRVRTHTGQPLRRRPPGPRCRTTGSPPVAGARAVAQEPRMTASLAKTREQPECFPSGPFCVRFWLMTTLPARGEHPDDKGRAVGAVRNARSCTVEAGSLPVRQQRAGCPSGSDRPAERLASVLARRSSRSVWVAASPLARRLHRGTRFLWSRFLPAEGDKQERVPRPLGAGQRGWSRHASGCGSARAGARA